MKRQNMRSKRIPEDLALRRAKKIKKYHQRPGRGQPVPPAFRHDCNVFGLNKHGQNHRTITFRCVGCHAVVVVPLGEGIHKMWLRTRKKA